MNSDNNIRQEKFKNPDELFIHEFFSTFDDKIRSLIQSILDLYQDKFVYSKHLS